MNTRYENLYSRLAIQLAIDPILVNRNAVRSLKRQATSGSKWIRAFLRYAVDPTILPPPSYTRRRADEVYGDAFTRCMEFANRNAIPGSVLEFGTLLGYTARWWAGLIRKDGVERELYLYDSFEGLPEITSEEDATSYEVVERGSWFKGAMGIDPEIDIQIRKSLARILGDDRIHVIKGYFDQTLPNSLPGKDAAIVHIDCDLYSSTIHVLTSIFQKGLLQDGTILIMDDYNCNRANSNMGERSALTAFLESQNKFLATPWFSYGWHGQVFFLQATSSK